MTETQQKAFAKRLNEALDRAGAPPMNGGRGEWLADRAGVTKSAVSRWLSGTSMPHRRHIKELAKAVRCDWVFLETGEHADAKLDEDVLKPAIRGAALGLKARGVDLDADKMADVVLRVYAICVEERLGAMQAETVAKVMIM